MKIRWLDRLVLVFTSLLLIFEAAVVGMLALGYGRVEFAFWSEILLERTINRVLLCVLAVLVLLIALKLLFMRVGKRSQALPDAIFMLSTDAGTIRITLGAIEAIVQRACRGNAQVRDLRVKILPQENQLRVVLRVMLTPDANVREVATALQATVKQSLEENTGIPVPEVQLIIEATPNAALQRVE